MPTAIVREITAEAKHWGNARSKKSSTKNRQKKAQAKKTPIIKRQRQKTEKAEKEKENYLFRLAVFPAVSGRGFRFRHYLSFVSCCCRLSFIVMHTRIYRLRRIIIVVRRSCPWLVVPSHPCVATIIVQKSRRDRVVVLPPRLSLSAAPVSIRYLLVVNVQIRRIGNWAPLERTRPPDIKYKKNTRYLVPGSTFVLLVLQKAVLIVDVICTSRYILVPDHATYSVDLSVRQQHSRAVRTSWAHLWGRS